MTQDQAPNTAASTAASTAANTAPSSIPTPAALRRPTPAPASPAKPSTNADTAPSSANGASAALSSSMAFGRVDDEVLVLPREEGQALLRGAGGVLPNSDLAFGRVQIDGAVVVDPPERHAGGQSSASTVSTAGRSVGIGRWFRRGGWRGGRATQRSRRRNRARRSACCGVCCGACCSACCSVRCLVLRHAFTPLRRRLVDGVPRSVCHRARLVLVGTTNRCRFDN